MTKANEVDIKKIELSRLSADFEGKLKCKEVRVDFAANFFSRLYS